MNEVRQLLISSKNPTKRIVTRRWKSLSRKGTYDNVDTGANNLDLCDSKAAQDSLFPTDDDIKIKWSSIFLTVFSLFSFFFDFGSDIYLMVTYYNQENYFWFILTLIFIFPPAFIMTSFSIIWYWNDRDSTFSYTGWTIRLILHFFQLSPVVRNTDTLIYAWRSKFATNDWDKTRYYYLMIYEEADSSLLRVMECSMESIPQLLLQLYILFTQPKVKDQSVVIIQCVSTVLSLISVSWSLSSYQSSLRITTPGKKQMNVGSMIIMVFWKLLLILPRFLSIALFTSVYKLYTLIVLGIHYTLMAIYIIAQETTVSSSKKFTFREIVFNLVMAVIYCVDYLNLKEGCTRYKYILYYGISFIEILTLIIFWYNNPPFESVHLKVNYNVSSSYINETNYLTTNFYYQTWSEPVRKLVLLETVACFLIGLVLLIIYYLRFHPTNNIRIFKSKTNVKENLKSTSGDCLPKQTKESTQSKSEESV